MSDRLQAEIDKARDEYERADKMASYKTAEAAEAVRLRDVAEARLDALELAASLRPPITILPSTQVDRVSASSGKGRQPGAISKPWRAILLRMSDDYPHGATDEEIADIARTFGLASTRAKDAKDRMTDYQGHGYVEPGMRGWRVTDMAIARFGDSSISATTTPNEAETAAPVPPSAPNEDAQ